MHMLTWQFFKGNLFGDGEWKRDSELSQGFVGDLQSLGYKVFWSRLESATSRVVKLDETLDKIHCWIRFFSFCTKKHVKKPPPFMAKMWSAVNPANLPKTWSPKVGLGASNMMKEPLRYIYRNFCVFSWTSKLAVQKIFRISNFDLIPLQGVR